jgi:hypothetical protein
MKPMRVFALVGLVGIALLLSAQVPDIKIPRRAPEQPVPFSHKTHAGMVGLPCKQCHVMPEPGDFMTLPATQVCMGCHTTVKKDSPHIAKVAAAHEAGTPLKWAPVYRIPDFVSFSHKRHTAVPDVTCATCHGPVATRDVMSREKEISMQACMDCHRQKRAENGCTFCHDAR